MKSIAVVLCAIGASLMQAQNLPEGPGKRLVEDICTGCHGLDSVVSQRATRQGWESTVDYMIQRGATAKDEEIKAIVDYLTKNFGAKVNVNKASARDIADGLELTPQESDAIVNYRKSNGDFKDLDGLKKVSGVDGKKLDAKKDSIQF